MLFRFSSDNLLKKKSYTDFYVNKHSDSIVLLYLLVIGFMNDKNYL